MRTRRIPHYSPQGQERYAAYLSDQIHTSLVTVEMFADDIRFVTHVYVAFLCLAVGEEWPLLILSLDSGWSKMYVRVLITCINTHFSGFDWQFPPSPPPRRSAGKILAANVSTFESVTNNGQLIVKVQNIGNIDADYYVRC